MNLWDPFEEMRRFRREMERAFDNLWGKERRLLPAKGMREPLVDISDKGNELEIITEIPGVNKEDITINIEQDRIEIKAQRKLEKKEKKKNFYRQERSYSSFYKAFTLPAIVNPDQATCEYKKGLLHVHLPKLKPLKKKRKTLLLK